MQLGCQSGANQSCKYTSDIVTRVSTTNQIYHLHRNF